MAANQSSKENFEEPRLTPKVGRKTKKLKVKKPSIVTRLTHIEEMFQ